MSVPLREVLGFVRPPVSGESTFYRLAHTDGWRLRSGDLLALQ